ncbi:MAG: methyl-accepting chemotaxis protein [Mariprofundaceae bacterium]|nr:methyl-accepting chemotaxis protein [Mariprofundaceae bacterium]
MVDEKKHDVKSVRQLAQRNIVISVILFAVLIGAVFVASNRAADGVSELSELYGQQTSLEKFKGSLPNVLLPLNDFTLTQNKLDIDKIKTSSDDFLGLYEEVSQLPSLDEQDVIQLEEVHSLMQEVIKIAEDITSGKIPSQMASNVTVVAQSLVFVAQGKLNDVASRLAMQLEAERGEKQDQLELFSLINVVIIVFIVIVMAFFNRSFVTNISGTISGMSKGVTDVSEEILAAADQQATASNTQAMSVAGVTGELEDMSGAAKKIAITAVSVERIAMATAASAKDGSVAVNEAIASMDRIRQEVNTIAEKVTDSGRKAEQILDSISSIKEIADETHLLALNASIESAAAGEFGKRFAVVAGEVRRLSERAKEFTEEIQIVVNDVHVSTRESIEVTRAGLEEVAKGVEIAQRASLALGKMENMSEKTSQAVRTIAQATGRQDESSQEFVLTMQQISDLLQDSATQMQKTRDASHRLNDVASDLQKLI